MINLMKQLEFSRKLSDSNVDPEKCEALIDYLQSELPLVAADFEKEHNKN